LARLVAEQLGVDELALAVGDSVDFRLLFSVPENDVARLHDEFHARGWDLFEIGRLDAAAGAPGAFLRSDDGGVIPLPGIEWAQADVLTIDALRASGVEKSE
jgi:thiamine monophosphate kinase